MKFHKPLRFMAGALLAASMLVGQCSLPASVAAYTPSPTVQDFQVIIAIDSEKNDVSDILLVTPYTQKGQLQQQYKQECFETAMNDLTWEAAENALKPHIDDTDFSYHNLSSEVVFYAHEKDDSGIIQLPVEIQIPTNLRPGDFCEELAYMPKADSTTESGEVEYEWVWIPSQLHDGYITLTVDTYTAYTILTYHVTENPDETVPTQPSEEPTSSDSTDPTNASTPTEATKPGTTGPTIPHSPQTGEEESEGRNYTLPLAIVAGILAAYTSRRKSKR